MLLVVGAGEPISFVGQQEKSWFNPLHWEVLNNKGIRDDYLMKSVPFIDRIPCSHDRVSFTKGDAFRVDISENVVVKEVRNISRFLELLSNVSKHKCPVVFAFVYVEGKLTR